MAEEEPPEIDGGFELHAFLAGLARQDCRGSGISDADSSRETVSRKYPGAREIRTECVFVNLSEEVHIFKQSFADQTHRGLLFLKGFAFQRPPTLNEAVAAQFTHSGCGKLGKDGEDGGFVESDAEFGEVLHGARGADDVRTVRCIFCHVCKFGISNCVSLASREGKRHTSIFVKDFI